ncbi:MAG TPA: AMP-binding protein, partial [Kofleriaceae bacterium]|nr:AMP-binding protein [Kofleriaceae bacterium]
MLTQLDYVYLHEEQRPDTVWLVQPMGDGSVREFTWKQAVDEAKRMAAHLVSLDLPRSSQIAIFAKNNAWWFLSDLAIWMAGHVSVPLYATLSADTIRTILEHSETRAILIGKLDGYDAMAPGIPANLHRIAMPLAPPNAGTPWNDIIATTPPVAGTPRRDPDELATIVYTSGSTGMPKGVMHSFRTMAAAFIFTERLHTDDNDRLLSYLPLAHVYERAVVEICSMKSAARIYFAESLDTFIADLRRARPTLFVSVPRLWLKFQQAVFEKMPPAMLDKLLADPAMRDGVRKKVLDGLGLGEVRHAATGSAPIPEALL